MENPRLSIDETTIRLRHQQQITERDRTIGDLRTRLSDLDAAYGDAVRLADEMMSLAARFGDWLEESDPIVRQGHKLDIARLGHFARAVFAKLSQARRA